MVCWAIKTPRLGMPTALFTVAWWIRKVRRRSRGDRRRIWAGRGCRICAPRSRAGSARGNAMRTTERGCGGTRGPLQQLHRTGLAMAMRGGLIQTEVAGCFATHNSCPTATSWQSADRGGAAIEISGVDAGSSATASIGVLCCRTLVRPRAPPKVRRMLPTRFLENTYKVLTCAPDTGRLCLEVFCKPLIFLVARGGIEPSTRGFSIRCSTN